MNTTTKNRIIKLLSYLFLAAISLIFIFPFVYMFSKSLMTDKEVLTLPAPIFPELPQWNNYVKAFQIAPFLKYTLNTFIILGVNLIAVPLSAALCAFGFSRIAFKGRDVVFSIVLATMMLPSIVVQIPLYVTFSKLSWINTFLPLTVPALFGGGSVNIFLMRQFFKGIPKEIDNAAMIDGANKLEVFIRIILPLSVPVLTLVAVSTFSGVWNDFMGPLLYLKDQNTYTLAMGMYVEFKGTLVKNAWPNYEMAMGTLMIIPPALIFFIFQRNIISGVATSGLKV